MDGLRPRLVAGHDAVRRGAAEAAGGNRRQDAGAADLEAGTHDIAFVRAADRPSCD